MDDPSPQVRLGVIGLGRSGLFALERWLDGGAVCVVAACDRDAESLRRAETLCDCLTQDAAELLAATEIDAVFVAVPASGREELARQVLAAGKHLLVEPPLADSLREAQSLLEAAQTAGRQIVVWSHAREVPDFRAAQHLLRSGTIGTPRLFRFERWEPADIESTNGAADIPPAFVGLLDQVVALAKPPASSAFAAPLAAGGITATVTFRDGPVATLIWKTSASARLDHGWAIDADRGGDASGRRWVRTAEGEVYELPAEVPPVPTIEDSLRRILTGGTPEVSAAESLRLVALMATVRRSLSTGQVEPVEDTP